MSRIISIIVAGIICIPFAYGQEGDKYGFSDRAAVKTNAFEWLITVPNIAFEYDFVRTDYRKVSLTLGAKYNWNTYHKLAPATVFDLFEFRPEFRYYFRTKNLKVSRPWWVMYVGPYASHGTYTFKLSQKGISGYASGAGISAGYVIPMYEYGKGAIDVELGASVGVQVCTKDVFTHNPEGHYYTRLEEESVGRHVTPFPVISELKVAFVWRKESIRHQVKTDMKKAERKALYQKNLRLMIEDIDAHLPMELCAQYESIEDLEKELDNRVEYLYGDQYIRSSFYSFSKSTIRSLERRIKQRAREVRRNYKK